MQLTHSEEWDSAAPEFTKISQIPEKMYTEMELTQCISRTLFTLFMLSQHVDYFAGVDLILLGGTLIFLQLSHIF